MSITLNPELLRALEKEIKLITAAADAQRSEERWFGRGGRFLGEPELYEFNEKGKRDYAVVRGRRIYL